MCIAKILCDKVKMQPVHEKSGLFVLNIGLSRMYYTVFTVQYVPLSENSLLVETNLNISKKLG